MLNGFVVQTITRQQHTYAGLSSEVARANLVKLGDGLAGFVRLPKFQISLGQQVEALRMVRIFLQLFGQIGEVLLSPRLARKTGAFVNVVENVLIRLGTRGRIL